MGQSSDQLIALARISRDPKASASPVAPLPRTCAPPAPKPTARPRPRKKCLDLLEAIRLEEEGSQTEESKKVRLATAVKEGQDHLVLRLLQADAPLDGLDGDGVSPLTRAVEARRPAIVAALLKYGATSEPGLVAR